MLRELEFTCAGISTLPEFGTLVAELRTMDPVSSAIHADPGKHDLGDTPAHWKKAAVLKVFPKLDALIHLLAASSDSLAATVACMNDNETVNEAKPVIQ